MVLGTPCSGMHYQLSYVKDELNILGIDVFTEGIAIACACLYVARASSQPVSLA